MMKPIEEVTRNSSGARFYRVDLHIHSHGASHDVRDATMSPEAIVAKAREENLDVIAVTDHNEISNVSETLAAGKKFGILVIPATELSTSGGHLLCYLPSMDKMQKFFAGIEIADRGNKNSRCKNSLHDCLNILEQNGGFGILAHVDIKDGFENENPGNAPHKLDVLCHPALLAVEVIEATSPVTYAEGDTDADRSKVSAERVKRLKLGSNQNLARVLNSDAHALARVGRNSRGFQKITRVKMQTPSFDALRIALGHGDARVRIEDQIPASVPYVLGVRLQGGFLDGQDIHFSKNLNCIIGGRGTGKSTAFEAVRCLIGSASASPNVDSEVWPTQVYLFWEDQAGQRHTLVRPKDGTVSNIDDPLDGPTGFKVECYGQGETADISKQAHDNPLALLSYLDRFVDITEDAAAENDARDKLLEIQTSIEAAQKDVSAIPECERILASHRQQLDALKQAKAEEIIDLQQKLEEEREIRSQVSDKLIEIEGGLDAIVSEEMIDELVALADPKKLTVGAAEFRKIISGARIFEKVASGALEKTRENFGTFSDQAKIQIAEWKTKEAATVEIIEKKRKAIEAQGGRLDMVYIQKLAKNHAKAKAELNRLRKADPLLKRLRREAATESKKRWAARERVATTRDVFGKQASDTLRDTLTDLQVSLKFTRSAYSPNAEAQITKAMGWRTTQVPKAALLIERLTVPGLMKAIDGKDILGITALKHEGAALFNKAEATELLTKLSETGIRFGLERCEVHDLPRLTITRPVDDGAGNKTYRQRDFSKLSLGQQQSVLLALMLSTTSNCPLIIDQPEDNLDSEFIYHSLVPVLRRAKERRQIIIVTHNPNIAVLGDAEQIIVLKSTNEKGQIVARGSIDDEPTQRTACNVLEGADEAFIRRGRIYGFLK